MTKKPVVISVVIYIIARCAELYLDAQDLNEINRLLGLAYVLGLVIVESVPFALPIKGFTHFQICILAAPIGNCDRVRRISFLYAVAMPFTVLLLVFRVVAFYKNDKSIVIRFTLWWHLILTICIMVPMGVKGVQIENTPHCIGLNFKPYAIIGAITPAIHSALIFIAITRGVMKNTYMETNLKNPFSISMAFFKCFLRDGQLYLL